MPANHQGYKGPTLFSFRYSNRLIFPFSLSHQKHRGKNHEGGHLMEIFALITSLILLNISPNLPTTFTFEEPIEYFSLGNEGDFSTYLSKNKKILVVTPKIATFKVPLVVLSNDFSYQITLKNESNSPPIYFIKKGKKDNSYSLLKSTESFRLLEGANSNLLYLNSDADVNGILTKKGKFYLSKGSQIFLNGEKIL
jgi:hypothetical protein